MIEGSMRQFMFLMHDDTVIAEDGDAWGPYLSIDEVAARGFLDGNPVYEAGGTVEIRELIVD